ncbi:MAG: excinuclease ABC subunit UvrA [Actinomycetota bacterium]|nr:excinuclease ABC subunit UvrA [Actinomycetota bacterium]
MADKIIIRGAREHNLKNINVELPRDEFIVMTGISGSGKSSLAIDTIYAEGQRRYVESLSAYARQFLGQMEKPDVELIEGLSPAICIDQKSAPKNPRSTVGTITEIYDYLRLLYARIGTPHCPNCGREIAQQSSQQIIEQISTLPSGTKFQILAPVVRGRKGEYRELLERLRKEGFARVQIDGRIYGLDEDIRLDRDVRHNIDVVVDRLIMKEGVERRLADSIETALNLADGIVAIEIIDGERLAYRTGRPCLPTGRQDFSTHFACIDCGISFEELSPRMFSFNSPYGACSYCGGLGTKMEVDPDLVVPNPDLSLREGAVAPFYHTRVDFYPKIIRAVAEQYGINMDTPWRDLEDWQKQILMYGTGDEQVYVRYRSLTGRIRSYYTSFSGVVPNLNRRYREAESDYAREKIEQYMSVSSCPQCKGARLKLESLAVTVGGLNIYEFSQMCAKEALKFTEKLKASLSPRQMLIAQRIIKEIQNRLKFMIDVGLDYLTLDRSAATLAGGEAQRIRLATQIGSGLAGVLYILDEPSIGLHQRDNRRLIESLKRLRDLGNTIIVVEHDETTIRSADFIVDIGPGAGEHGGRIVVTGGVEDLIRCPQSITGKYLSGERKIPLPPVRRKAKGKYLTIKGASEHNLKDIDVPIPLGLFVCNTGVSGSGKSTLVSDVLYRSLAAKLYKSREKPGKHEGVEGLEYIDKVINIDQSPIGRTPRSNPATYVKVFDDIRRVFAEVPEAKIRGYKPGRFSFNVRGGRCDACQGDGTIKIEMHFLPDIYIPCEVCKGKRYNRETLEVKFKGKTIADVLNMSVEEALKFLENIPNIRRRLQTLYDVGLGYIKLGQPAPTLSGGEAQRVKLAAELSKKATGRTLYILDEPTTGLHFADIEKLLDVLNRLVDQGNTVLVIEHNLDVIKTADYIIDLGPEGGEEGGYVIASGTPEEIMENPRSYTGRFLKLALEPVAAMPCLKGYKFGG